MIVEFELLVAYTVVAVVIRQMDNNLIVQYDLVQERDDQQQQIRFRHEV
jgi:hypothetical protein